jgi:hypothetical protein
MELNKITSFKTFSELKSQKDAVKTEQENKTKRVKSLEKISSILDELQINDMSELDEEKKKALYAKLFSEDRAEEIEAEIVAKGKEKDESDEVGDIAGKGVADEVEEDKAEDIEDDINKLGEPKEEEPKEGEELESELDEAKVTLDAIEPDEEGLVKFCKKKGIKWKIVNMNGPAANYPEVEYIGKKKDLEAMIQGFWGEDSGLEEFIEESVVNEARSINKIQNEWTKVTAGMAELAKQWKAAEGDAKDALLAKMKEETAKKKALEAELDDAVTGKDKDLELVVTEGNAFTGALFAARNKGEKTFEFNGKTYKVRTSKVNEEDDEVKEAVEVEEGNAFGDAVRKAKEAGEKEFEFDGKTYKVEEALTEGSHGMAKRLLQEIIDGNTSRAEGTKMSKELAAHFLTWVESSPFGKKNGNLPLDMLIKASFNWGIERGLDPKLKGELSKLKETVKESNEIEEGNAFGDAVRKAKEAGEKEFEFDGKKYKVEESKHNPSVKVVVESVNEAKQFDKDYADMETSIKRGIGWIDPEYVETTWENSSDTIDFEIVKAELYKRLLKAGLLWYGDEEKETQVKSLKELGIKESVVNEAAKFKNTKNFEDFLEEIDGMGESQIKKIMGKDYIDTPGGYRDEAEDYDNDIEEYMISNMGKSSFEELKTWWENNVAESVVNEAEVKSDDEFKEYAMTVLKKAFGADFDEAKAEEVVDGILKKCDGDYGAAVGMLTSSLGESVTNETIDVSYWEDYNDDTSGHADPSYATKVKVFDIAFEEAVETWNDEAEGEENQIDDDQSRKIEKLAYEFFKRKRWISINIIHAMIAQES